MKLSKKTTTVLMFATLTAVSLIYFYVLPVVSTVYSDIKEYRTQTAYRDDYTNFTTPLSKEVVNDICAKLNIEETSKNCLPGAVVYGPDFFDEIKMYFNEFPAEKKTYESVGNILGTYLVLCDTKSSQGDFGCYYDLRGDKRYEILFLFDKNGFYYDVIANTGGS
jgi:hypothetical protein